MDTPDDHASQEHLHEENEVEITDLEPAKDGVGQGTREALPPFSRFLRWQHPSGRRRFRLLTTFALLFLVILVIMFGLQSGFLANLGNSISSHLAKHASQHGSKQFTGGNIGPARIILPPKSAQMCVADAAWSPESVYLAFFGYQGDCSLHTYTPSLLTVYATASGKLVSEVRPDDAIFRAFHAQYPQFQESAISYAHVLWSPDGKHLFLFDPQLSTAIIWNLNVH